MNYWSVRNAWEGPACVCIKRPLGRAVKEREMPAALLSCGFLRFQVSHSLFSLLLPLPTLRSYRARSCSSWKWKVFSTSRLPGSAAVPWHRNPSAEGRSLPGARFQLQLPLPFTQHDSHRSHRKTPGPRKLHPADARFQGIQCPHRCLVSPS